jgi:hypothetical protein
MPERSVSARGFDVHEPECLVIVVYVPGRARLAMATIDHNTLVVITMKQLVGTVIALLAGGGAVGWAVINFTIGGVRDDVSAIRGDMGKMQEFAMAEPPKINDAEAALTNEISTLRVDLERFRGDFRGVQVALTNLQTQVEDLKKQPARKVDWSFTPEDGSKLITEAAKAGIDSKNFIVVPLVAGKIKDKD